MDLMNVERLYMAQHDVAKPKAFRNLYGLTLSQPNKYSHYSYF